MSDRASVFTNDACQIYARITFRQLSGKLFCHGVCPTGQITINKLSRPAFYATDLLCDTVTLFYKTDKNSYQELNEPNLYVTTLYLPRVIICY